MSTPTPAVGRVVHYVSYGTPGGEYSRECRAATITQAGAWVDVETSEVEGPPARRSRSAPFGSATFPVPSTCTS